MAPDSFLEFTESDALNRLSQTAPRSTFAAVDRTDSAIYLHKDYGALEVDDFIHKLDFRITAIAVSAATQERIAVITYCKDLNDWDGNRVANKDQLSLIIKSNNVGNQFTLVLSETEGGNEHKNSPAQVYVVGTTYYAKIKKIGTSASIFIYSDEDRTTLIDSSVLVLQSDYAFRYLLIPQSLDVATAFTCSGYVENLDTRRTTWAEAMIRRVGEDIPIYRESEGAVGTYGDPASTWALHATERMLITRPKPSVRDSIAGRIDQSEYVAHLLGDTVARSHDYLLLDGVKYEVIKIDTLKKRGTRFSKVAQLKRMDEG